MRSEELWYRLSAMIFFVGATFGRPHGLYKFKPCRSQKRAVEGASPYSFFGQNRSARCWGTTMVSDAHSSFLIPHSSFLIPNSLVDNLLTFCGLFCGEECGNCGKPCQRRAKFGIFAGFFETVNRVFHIIHMVIHIS